MNSELNEKAVYDLIDLFEMSPGTGSIDDLLPPGVPAETRARFRGAVTAEHLGRIVDESISGLTEPAAREKARGRWHAAKMAMLSDHDPAVRTAAAAALAGDDLEDPAVIARFRQEVEHGDPEVVMSFAEAFAENSGDDSRDAIATALTEFAEALSGPELTMVLQVLGTIYTRARAAAPVGILERLAAIAARSLMWEPEPAMLCAWSLETSGRYDVLAEWLRSPDLDLASFGAWIANKVAGKLAGADRAMLRDALRQLVARSVADKENPRAAVTTQRARDLLAAME